MSICYKLVTTVSVLLLITAPASSQAPELSSSLYSTISGAFVAFSNENITFACIVRGSNVIEWSSVEYIGTGGRTLEFSSTDMPGSQDIAGETVATLVRATQDVIIESRLNIRVRSTISVATIRCQDGGTGENTQIMFRLAGNDTSVACDRQAACPGETVNCACATGGSNTLAWVINRLEFTSNDPPLTRRSVNALGILTNRHSDNRVQVITSNLTLTASTDDTNLMIQCENVDGSTSNALPITIPQNCPDPSEQVTTPAGNEAASATDCGGSIAAAAVVPAFLIIIVAIVAVVIVYLAFKRAYNKKQRALQQKYDKKNDDLEEEYTGKQRELQQEYDKKNDDLEEEYKGKQLKLQQKYDKKTSSLEDEKRILEQEKSDLHQQQENLIKKESKMENDMKSLKDQLHAANRAKSEMKSDMESLKNQLHAANRTATKAKNEAVSLKDQLDALKQQQK